MILTKLVNKVKKAFDKGFIYMSTYLLWNLKFYFLRLFNVNKVQSKYNIILYTDFNDATFRFYYFANYGFFYSNYLKNYLLDFVFVDIGANKGLYTILAAKNSNCEKVVSFEPIPSTYEFLKKNSELNNIAYKCDFHNYAISDKCEESEILFDPKHSGTASLTLKKNEKNFDKLRIHTVNCELLNSMFSSKCQNYIIKVDVEGFELTVLKEIFKCNFSKFITSIFYEVNINYNPNILEEILRSRGFNRFEDRKSVV